VAGVLERRVWIRSLGEKLYPNLYVLLVAPPGVGKTQAIKTVYNFWKKTPGLITAPDSMTRAALIDSLEKASRKFILSPTEMAEYNSMQIAADELGVLMSAHDLDFLSHLNKIFDNPDIFDEARRMFAGKNKIIHNPQLSILAGTQPGFMASVLPEEAWSMGFTSRLIMVYSAVPVKMELFSDTPRNEKLKDDLQKDLAAMMNVYGELKFTAAAKELVISWNKEGMKPTPTHSKLEHYNTRRILYLLKLCQVSAVSRGNALSISEADFHRALTWLIEAERTMPDVFRNMTQKSDAMVIQDLHFFLWQIYAKEKKPIHDSLIYHFLQQRVPSDKIARIIEIAERANVIVREAGTNMYRPQAKDKIGVE